jgi:anti-sigma factor RsiW
MSDYLDGELAAEAKARLEHHVADCPDCRGLLHSLRRMLRRLERLPPPSDMPNPDHIAAAVRTRLHEATA